MTCVGPFSTSVVRPPAAQARGRCSLLSPAGRRCRWRSWSSAPSPVPHSAREPVRRWRTGRPGPACQPVLVLWPVRPVRPACQQASRGRRNRLSRKADRGGCRSASHPGDRRRRSQGYAPVPPFLEGRRGLDAGALSPRPSDLPRTSTMKSPVRSDTGCRRITSRWSGARVSTSERTRSPLMRRRASSSTLPPQVSPASASWSPVSWFPAVLGSAGPAPALVGQPAVGDGEQPGTELGLGAGERVEVAEGTKEDLADEVLGLTGPLQAEVPAHGGGELLVDGFVGPGGVGSQGGVEYLVKRLTEAHAASSDGPRSNLNEFSGGPPEPVTISGDRRGFVSPVLSGGWVTLTDLPPRPRILHRFSRLFGVVTGRGQGAHAFVCH